MATRHADTSRRFTPPRRTRSRSPGRRDRSRDRYSDRYSYGGGRSRNDRDRFRDRDRDYRDDRRERDSRRRSRSPGRRDRSRDRYPSDRYSNGRGRYERDRTRSRERDDRDRRQRSSSRPRTSNAGTPNPDSRRDKVDPLSREEKQKREQEKQQQDKQAAQQAKLAKLEEWKKKNAERLAAAKKQSDTPGAGSPIGTGPSTPTVAATPPASEMKVEPAKAKVSLKATTEKHKQKQPEKSTFKLDESAAARPLLSKPVGKPASSTSNAHRTFSKADGNISSFGLSKAKSTAEIEPSKKVTLLDDEDKTGKRKLQVLPEFAPIDDHAAAEDDEPEGDEDTHMNDLDDEDANANARLQARLEKRRQEMTNEDTPMEEAPTATGESVETMEVDETAGAEDDDIDPLDAFMAGLTDNQRAGPQGQTMFDDDNEPDLTAVEGEDLLALAATKKKKKDIPMVDHSKIEYEPFRKNFYTEPAEVTQMTPEEVSDLRHELDGIVVKPDDVARPVTKWAQMGLLQQTMDVFMKVGYERPTSIQAQAIPIAESGRDLIGVAKTGSGKTLAFGIPMIRHILDQRALKSSDGPISLILAPTRELASQITKELKPFLNASNITIKCAYGGPPISEQIAMIKRGGIHVLCATPGRLIDLLQSNSGRVLSLKRITYVVLDEADRMFDMGFEPQVMKVLGNIRPDRQAILFSATFPRNMAALAKKALTKPAEVVIGGRSIVASEITQVISLVEPSYEKKISNLLLHLGQYYAEDGNEQVLVFVERQETAEDLLAKLIKARYPSVNTIHGAKDQADRNEAISDFKKGALAILIATSVAARGLDVPGLAMVVNFDCPTHLEDYVHRCGRTGRAGNKGTAITLIENPGQERFAVHLVKALTDSKQEVPEELLRMADTFKEKVKSGTEKFYTGFGGKGGLDKLDAARALEKKREKRAHKLGDDDESDDEPELPIVKNAESAAGLPGAAATNGNAAAVAAAEPEQPHYMKLLNKIVVTKTERPAPGPTKPMSAKEKAMAAANKVDGRLSKKGMIHAGQPIDNKGPDAGLYHSTIEINDFPQKARWAVTNRTNVAKILDATGVSITTKGNYYPPGKEPGENDLPKLYILVEGDTENVVTQAMMELTRHLKEGTIAAEEATVARGATGKYSVV